MAKEQPYLFEAIGTRWGISFRDALGKEKEENTLALVRERVARFDQDYSRFRADSWVSHIATKPGVHQLPSDAKPLFDLYKELYDVTDGAVTPLIGDVLVAAGYDAEYSLVPKIVTEPYTWEQALEYVFPNLTVKEKTVLDLGAAGKGYIVDLVAEILKEQGHTAFGINAGGDICVFDTKKKSVRIALEHPEDQTQAIGVATVSNQSICGSAGNRRAWSTYTHIIDPHTLKSPQSILSLWVVADTTLIADGLATALFFTEPSALEAKFTFDYLILRPDYRVEQSGSFPAELFLL